jgi:glycosyltransferase involved in cell wall biosynthesis
MAHNRYRTSGGEETHISLLERGLVELGVEVRRFERNSNELKESTAKRVATGLSLAYRPGGGGIRSVLADWRPDVVHFHNLWPLLTPSALRIARHNGAAVVLTTHNYRFACPGGTLLRGGLIHEDCIEGSSLACAFRNPREMLAESLAYGLALDIQRRLGLLERWVDAFIAPSAFLGRMLVRAGLPEQRVHVIPHGVPRLAQSPRRGRYALYAGRLSAEKGVRTLLQATVLAPDVPVAIAGAGPLGAEVRRAAVVYLGQLDRAGVIHALGEAAFAVVPSECYEALGFAALEALSAGKPVVASSLGGLAELVQEGVTGMLIPPRSPECLAQAMQQLWHQPQLTRDLGSQGLNHVRQEFALEGQAQKVLSLYERLASRTSRSSGTKAKGNARYSRDAEFGPTTRACAAERSVRL